MSDTNDETNQATPNEPVEQPAESKDLSLAEELAQANDKSSDEEKPEAPVEEGAKPEEAEQPKEPEVEPPKEEEPKENEEPVETEAERKQRFYEMRQQQKQVKQQVEQSISQQYQPQQVDELTQHFIDQGYGQFEAEMLARDERRNQEAEINKATTQVAQLNMRFGTEAVQVMHDFPIFDPKSPEYDKEYAARASKLFESHAGVQKDPQTGMIVAASTTPYNFYKELAEMRGSAQSKAQVVAQKAAEQQMASAAPPSSSVPQTSKSEEDSQAERLAAAFAKTA